MQLYLTLILSKYNFKIALLIISGYIQRKFKYHSDYNVGDGDPEKIKSKKSFLENFKSAAAKNIHIIKGLWNQEFTGISLIKKVYPPLDSDSDLSNYSEEEDKSPKKKKE